MSDAASIGSSSASELRDLHEFFTAREAAGALGLAERTIRRAIARGDLVAVKQGGSYRISAGDLARYAERNERRTAPPSPRAPPSSSPRPFILPSPPLWRAPPSPLSPFIGRASELAAVGALLADPTVRLLTLTGPGGTGKTRLSLAAAERAADQFPDGVVFVDLAPIARPELVPGAIGDAFGVRESDRHTLLQRLALILRDKRALLILDNFEHVLSAAPLVTELLSEITEITALVTSRASLQVGGEHVFPVPPLGLPPFGGPATPATLLESDAGRLFVARAREHDPSFAVDGETAPQVAEVCARVDGLPLAIELAAARTTILSPRELLSRLEPCLPLLTSGAHDAPRRLQTMRDAIAWSYDLLGEDAQALFRRLAVFSGGFTLEAAEWMSDSPSPSSGLDLIASLREQSLLVREAGPEGTTRFRMLETVREFGLEHLAASGETPPSSRGGLGGEEEATRAAHARFFTQMVESLRRPALSQKGPLDRLLAEHANLRAALEWLAADDPAEGFVHLAALLTGFWYLGGHYREGREWLERALLYADAAPPLVRGRILVGLAWLLSMQGEYDAAEPLFAAGISHLRTAGNALETATASLWYGSCAFYTDDLMRAECFFGEAFALAEAAGDQPGAIATKASALANLGTVAIGQGNFDLAEMRHTEALRLRDAHGLDLAAAMSVVDLATIAHQRGDHQLAIERYRESLVRLGNRGELRQVAELLAGVASSATALDLAREAARLFGAAYAALERAGTRSFEPGWQARIDHLLDNVRRGLGEEAFAVAWAEGRNFSWAELMAEAAALGEPEPAETRATSSPKYRLSPRALDVLRLVAERLTDREIADRLFLSPRTVEWYVADIMGRLDAASRHEAVARATAEGLL